MVVRIKPLILVGVLAAFIGGCGRQEFPKAAVEPVEGFSLGSAKIQQFKKDPTPAELYVAELKLIDSLKSAEVSFESDVVPEENWSTDDKNNYIVPPDKEPMNMPLGEYRFSSPGKQLEKMMVNDSTVVRVINGNKLISVDLTDKTYDASTPNADMKKHMMATALNLSPVTISNDNKLHYRLIQDVTRRPDEKINGTDVYVLQFQVRPTIESPLPPETRRFYIGKQDLLPRRIEIAIQPRSAKFFNQHGALKRMIIKGFKCNTSLSDDLFTTTQPSGFKMKKAAELKSDETGA